MIKKASLTEAGRILYVINTANREAYRKIIPKEYFREPVLSMEKLLSDFKRMTFYVYETRGKVEGVSALQVENKRTGVIRWVYILPEHQRKGIGTALVRHLESKAKEIGMKRLWLLTVGKAYWAVDFYKKLGYMPFERIERPWGLDVLMEKKLSRRCPATEERS